MFHLCLFDCLSICLAVCTINYSESCERILMKFSEGVAWSKDQSVRFWWRSDSKPFKRFFICYCDSYSQRSIKHEHPWRRFELSECFLVVCVLNVLCQCANSDNMNSPSTANRWLEAPDWLRPENHNTDITIKGVAGVGGWQSCGKLSKVCLHI